MFAQTVPPPVQETFHPDGARDLHRPGLGVWRYDPAGRLAEIVHLDRAATIFEQDGTTLHFDPRGDFVWSMPAPRAGARIEPET